ncbi:MAG: PKD repeat protein [Aureispira sp.]|jgi:PKD repeat protein
MKKITLIFLLGISLFSFNSCQKDTPTPQVFPPEANFNASTTSIYKGMSIDFIDLSTINPSSWAWSFSGGTPTASNQQNPTIIYKTPGTYDVSLTVSNTDGSDTKTIAGHIVVNDATVQVLLDNNLSFKDILMTYPIDSLYGKQYQGGLIFYHNSDPSNSSIFVAADIDQSSGAQWGCDGTDLPNFDCLGSSIDDYSANAPSSCLAIATTAWGICYNLLYNNYSDWQLPNAIALVYMYQNLHLNGYGNFSPTGYWSYCETNQGNSKSVSFSDGSISDYTSKSSTNRVRAIRKLYF